MVWCLFCGGAGGGGGVDDEVRMDERFNFPFHRNINIMYDRSSIIYTHR